MALKPGSGSGKAGQSFQAGRVKVARWTYSFATQGGAQSTITLSGDEIPAGSLVVDARVDVTTLLAPNASNVRLDLEGAGDLRAAGLINAGVLLNTTGVKALLNLVKTTAVRDVSMVVSAADLTAGVLSVVVTYVELA